jgi:hypothetical protein
VISEGCMASRRSLFGRECVESVLGKNQRSAAEENSDGPIKAVGQSPELEGALHR